MQPTNQLLKPKIFFDEELHKYSDEFGNQYISVTTILGEFSNKFDTERMARNCERAGRKGDPRYKGKTAAMLKAEWKRTSIDACDNGSKKHTFLETRIKQATGYTLNASNQYIQGRIYTINDILDNPTFGRLELSYFESSGIKERYPVIYNLLEILDTKGFSFYAEIGVFDIESLISGLIDLFAIKGTDFYIVDWKTNKSPIRFEAGYFIKDNAGNPTNEFVFTNKKMKPPLSNLEDSVGNKYTLQLSMYGNMAEQFTKDGVNLNCLGLLLCHIRSKTTVRIDGIETAIETVDILIINYLKQEVEAVREHRKLNSTFKTQTQMIGLLML